MKDHLIRQTTKIIHYKEEIQMNEQVNKDNGVVVEINKDAKKPNAAVAFARKVKKGVEKLKKDHPILYKAGKLLSVAGAGYGTYKLGFKKGVKSVVPTTVYIQSGVNEDELEDVQEETPVEETNEEPAADELSEI